MLEPLDRSAHPIGTRLKVGLLLEHVLQQQSHSRARPRPACGVRDIGARVGEVALEAVEALEQLRRLGMAGQAFERRLALVDELSGERAVAVQRRATCTRAPHAGSDLERDLRAGLHLSAQMSGRGLNVVGEDGLQLPRAHRALPSRSRGTLLLGAPRFARQRRARRRERAPYATASASVSMRSAQPEREPSPSHCSP